MENIQNLIDEYNSIKDLKKDIGIVYHLLDELGIPYQPTTCRKCQQDLKMIVAEELGVIADASEESGFDTTEYRYTYAYWRPLRVDGKVYDRLSPQEDLETLYGKLGRVYVKREGVVSGQSV